MTLFFTLFVAGMLTILLPCILPLIPIVLGVSIAGRSKLRPLFTVLGMIVSFVGFTFLLLVFLRQFVEVADYMRIGTYYVLLLFGAGFAIPSKIIQYAIAALGGFFFLSKGIPSVIVASFIGIIAMYLGAKVATYIQQLGSSVQAKARSELGEDSPITAFIIGLTMGLVWVPCAGPALGFAFTLVREQPGLTAAFYLTAYGLGTALPLLLIGYGGQWAVHSVQKLNQYTGMIKQIAGVILIATALAFQFHWFTAIETWFVLNTSYGTLGTRLEEKFFGDGDTLDPSVIQRSSASSATQSSTAVAKPKPDPIPRSKSPVPNRASLIPNNKSSITNNDPILLPTLPKLDRAPEFTGLGPWHNSDPFTLESLKGKVVLVDFWTYSCINCIRTFPYLKNSWEKFKDQPFVLIGIHTPEFTYEKSEANVANALVEHGLTYPVAQDNDYGTWRAFKNRYWPAQYLIDAEGFVRYTHFGEGAYEKTDLAIQSLIAEIDSGT